MDFQSVNPELFILVGELLGNVIANEIPLNVQNAVGNWLQLVGQAILTYNAQQQYYQQGPGRYFTPDSFNVDNSFCQSNNQDSTSGSNPSNESQSTQSQSMTAEQFEQFQRTMEELIKRMAMLEQEIESLKRSHEK